MTDRTHPDSGRIITSSDILLHDAETALMYEEIRAAIDDGHESMTHAGALAEIAAIRAENTELRSQIAAIGAGGVSGPLVGRAPEGMVGGWQDIATAPKDGTHLLLWEQYSTNPFVGCWAFGSWSVSHEHVDAEGGWDGAIVVDSISQDRITHWMPLPPEPATSAGSGKGE